MSGLACRELALLRGDPAVRVLCGITMECPRGSLCLLQGAMGAGKSTLLHLLAGLLRPSEGEVIADGEPISRWTEAHRARWRRDLGFVFQQPRLLGGLTILENLALPLVPRAPGLDRAWAGALCEELGLGESIDRQVEVLSGGERQRVAIARALVVRPSFLLADEPTAHQDPDGAVRVLAALQAARDRGACVVASSHDTRWLELQRPDQILRLEHGTLEPGEKGR